MRWSTLILAAAIVLGGCTEPPAERLATVPDQGDPDEAPIPKQNPRPHGREEHRSNATQEAPPSPAVANSTNSSKAASPTPASTRTRDWASSGEAILYPGVRVAGNTSCTTNFLFEGVDHDALYLGVAAHCVSVNTQFGGHVNDTVPWPPGTPIVFGLSNATYWNYWINGTNVQHTRANVTGTLAYNSWFTMREAGEEPRSLASAFNDFALIRLPDDAERVTFPGLPGFGNVTGMASMPELQPLAKVYQFGNSRYWSDIGPPAQHKRGFITEAPSNSSQHWFFQAALLIPAFYGDSGSAIVLENGKAAGVFTNFAFGPGPHTPFGQPAVPAAGTGRYMVLETALHYMQQKTELNVRIVTA